MITASLNANDVARTFRVLRRIEPDLVRELRKDLRTDLKPTARAIASEFPAQPLLSGFERNFGRWEWGKVTGSVKITPGKSRKGAGRNNLVSLAMNYKGATPWAIDLLGSKSQGRTPQSQHLYRVLQQRVPGWPNGGRIFYKKFLESRGDVIASTESSINSWTRKVNQELS